MTTFPKTTTAIIETTTPFSFSTSQPMIEAKIAEEASNNNNFSEKHDDVAQEGEKS